MHYAKQHYAQQLHNTHMSLNSTLHNYAAQAHILAMAAIICSASAWLFFATPARVATAFVERLGYQRWPSLVKEA